MSKTFPAGLRHADCDLVQKTRETLAPVADSWPAQVQRVASLLQQRDLLTPDMLAILVAIPFSQHPLIGGLPAEVQGGVRRLVEVGTAPQEQVSFIRVTSERLALLMMANMVEAERQRLSQPNIRAALPEVLMRARLLCDEAVVDKATPALMYDFAQALEILRINLPGMDREADEWRDKLALAHGALVAFIDNSRAVRAAHAVTAESRQQVLKTVPRRNYKL